MEITGPLIGVLGLIIGVAGIYIGWWAPKAQRIRDALREAEPTVYFTIGSYGGPDGYGFGLNLQNRGTATAYDLALYLPGIEGFAWRKAELLPRETPYEVIPIASDAPIRTHQTEGLVARLAYHDRLGGQFAMSLDLTQERRADGFYNFGAAPQGPTITRPTLRFWDLWRLRNRV